jgi:hypothetical protein
MVRPSARNTLWWPKIRQAQFTAAPRAKALSPCGDARPTFGVVRCACRLCFPRLLVGGQGRRQVLQWAAFGLDAEHDFYDPRDGHYGGADQE